MVQPFDVKSSILEKLQKSTSVRNRNISALILVPTRELAIQIQNVFVDFNKQLNRSIKTMAVYGGISINPQMKGMIGVEFSGVRHDMGNKFGFIKANIDVGLAHPDTKDELKEYIKKLAEEL